MLDFAGCVWREGGFCLVRLEVVLQCRLIAITLMQPAALSPHAGDVTLNLALGWPGAKGLMQ